MSTTSCSPFSMLSSLLAEVTMSEIGSAKLCSSIAKRFSSVKVLGFMSKFFFVISISFCQCLSLKASLFKSENSGMESLNSFNLSSRMRKRGIDFTSFGSLLALLMNSSIPFVSLSMSRSAHSVLDHSSRATYKHQNRAEYDYVNTLHTVYPVTLTQLEQSQYTYVHTYIHTYCM